MTVHGPFDKLPELDGEYVARLDEFTAADLPLRNRRYFERGRWSAPYLAGDTPEAKAYARSKASEFYVYWTPIC